MLSPIPCSFCGRNFMRHDIDPAAPKLCNNCMKPKEKDMTSVDILITLSSREFAALEEYCINEGVKFSEYFMDLHRQHILKNVPVREQPREIEQSQNQFEDKAQISDMPLGNSKKPKGGKK